MPKKGERLFEKRDPQATDTIPVTHYYLIDYIPEYTLSTQHTIAYTIKPHTHTYESTN